MTQIVNLFIKHSLVIAFIFSLGIVTGMAQTAPPNGGPRPPVLPPDPVEIPIDGGASLLIAGGVAYGLKKLRDRRKR